MTTTPKSPRIMSSHQSRKNAGRIVLYGDAGLEFVAMSVDGADYTPRQDELENGAIPLDISATTEVSITARIDPAHNTALEGLYKSGGMYCTQCEPQGFRRIIWYADHPDMLSVFTTRIEAPRDLPCLLSNGNLIEAGELPDARHFAVWHDPHPKPSYLFAMVAGDLERVEDRFHHRRRARGCTAYLCGTWQREILRPRYAEPQKKR